MTQYVAFLRGINVGGNNIIKMDDLRKRFEAMGFSDVKTYIQSGNVIFQSEIQEKEKLEKIIQNALGFTVMVRSQKEMEKVVASFPTIFADPDWKHNVIFLSKTLDSTEVITRFALKPEIETVTYSPGVLFWSAKLSDLTRSSMVKLAAKKEYKEMTVRNLNTTQKILSLMK